MSEDDGARSRREVLYNLDGILDAHTHLTGMEGESAESILECMEFCGIDKVFLFAPMLDVGAHQITSDSLQDIRTHNDYCADLCSKAPERLLGFCTLNPMPALADGWYLADALLAQGRRIKAFAADDAHLRKGAPDAFVGWVEVRSEALEPEPILAALKAGHYYSSQGPEIHAVEVGEGSVLVRCSPGRGVFLGGRGPARARVLGEGIVECELPTDRFVGSSHLRVTVVDAAGKRAWTNLVWLDQGQG